MVVNSKTLVFEHFWSPPRVAAVHRHGVAACRLATKIDEFLKEIDEFRRKSMKSLEKSMKNQSVSAKINEFLEKINEFLSGSPYEKQ